MKMKPLLICITGPDGSGKSTACSLVRERLASRFGDSAVLEVSVWDCLVKQGEISPAFHSKEEAAIYLADLDGVSRSLFIFHAMSRALQLGSRSGARILLLNGYWFKYAVSELGYGVPSDVVLGTVQGFPRPDAVFCLDIEPQTAWNRRQKATHYEQGPEAGFVQFQDRLQKFWKIVENESGSGWHHLSAEHAPEQIAATIEQSVLEQLKASTA